MQEIYSRSSFIETQDFKNFNEESLLEDLPTLFLSRIFYITDINDKIKTFNEIFYNIYNKQFVGKNFFFRKIKKKAPWMKVEIKQLIEEQMNMTKIKFRRII